VPDQNLDGIRAVLAAEFESKLRLVVREPVHAG